MKKLVLLLHVLGTVFGQSTPRVLVGLIGLMCVLCGVRAEARTLDHSSGFANHDDLMANGSAHYVGTTAILTDNFGEAGSIFTVSPVQITNFSSDFEFTILPFETGIPLADGMTFCIQSAGPMALGGSGGGLGYELIPTSVAIKFDVFDNNGEGTNSTGVFTDGEFPSVPKSNGDVLIALSGTGIDLTSGDLFHAVITYHNGRLAIAITDTATGASFQKTISIDIPSVVGGSRAFVGFTGGTAGLAAVQTIYTWTFSGQGP